MGLFGSTKTVYLHYLIYLTDPALVANPPSTREDAATRVGGVVGTGQPASVRSPVAAAALYSAPIQIVTDPMVAPCVRSDWLVAVDQTWGHFSTNYPSNVDSFVRRSGGFLGFGGTETTYIWFGSFRYLPPADATPIPGTPGLPTVARRWIDGFEFPGTTDSGEGGSWTGNVSIARAASRHLAGFGLFLDNTTSARTHSPIENTIAASVTPGLWERFYVRIRRYPNAGGAQIWRVKGATSPNAGFQISMAPDGTLVLNSVDAAATFVLLGTTSALALHTWYKFDLNYTYNTGTGTGYFQLRLNGVLVANFSVLAAAGGLGQAQNIGSSTIGGSAAGFSWHVDDWVAAPYTIGASGPSVWVNSIDAINGTKVAFVGATGYATDKAAGWVGDWRTLRQRPGGTLNPQAVVSTTSGARLSITTDANLVVDDCVGAKGWMSFIVGLFGLRAGVPEGTLGYRFGPSPAAITANPVWQNSTLIWDVSNPPTYLQPIYSPNGLIVPKGGADVATRLAGLELVHDKGASVTSASAVIFGAAVELIGTFGQCDQLPDAVAADVDETRAPLGSHNAPYPRSPWGLGGVPPPAPIVVKGGTYAGTGTFVDLSFRAPVTFLWIRQVTANGPGVLWWSSMNAAHSNGRAMYGAEAPVDVLTDGTFVAGSVDSGTMALPPTPTDAQEAVAIANQIAYGSAHHPPDAAYWYQTGHVYTDDPDYFFRRILGEGAGGVDIPLYGPYATVPTNWRSTQEQSYIVRIVGNAANSNAAASTYQYVAFCDPGMRFSNNGALGVYGAAVDYVTPLDSEIFTPDAVWLMQEFGQNDAATRVYYKGPGHAATAIQFATGGAELAAGLQIGLGTLTSKSGLMLALSCGIAFAAFRRDDHSADAGVARVVQIGSYVGDGSASRSIALTPVSGRRPLFAAVQPHAGAMIFRDPSHTGTISTTFPASDVAATGITGGGIDTLSLGITLNANGIVYEYFVFPGDTTAGLGGFSPNGEFVPVEMGPPESGGAYDPTPAPVEVVLPGPGEDVPPVDTGDPIPQPGGVPAPFGTQCIAASTSVINLALSRIGVSKAIGDILNELSIEADTARLHYSEDVDATLRAHPWPFATKYATLVRVGGTTAIAVNGDWQYSYRWPADCLFARRLVQSTGTGTGLVGTANRYTDRKRAYDPAPPKFRIGGDDVGPLIYCDADLPELEYTRRPPCAASQGDAIFREALSWKHAASLAPILSRNGMTVSQCLQMFHYVIGTAATKAEDEQQQDPGGGPDWLDGR